MWIARAVSSASVLSDFIKRWCRLTLLEFKNSKISFQTARPKRSGQTDKRLSKFFAQSKLLPAPDLHQAVLLIGYASLLVPP